MRLADVRNQRKRNFISASPCFTCSNSAKLDTSPSTATPRPPASASALSTTPTRKAEATARISPGPLVAATVLVAALSGLFTLLAASSGFTNLLWAIVVPLLAGRAFDDRPHAWVATSLWLVMCSVATIVAVGQLA